MLSDIKIEIANSQIVLKTSDRDENLHQFFSDGLLKTKRNDKWGFVDDNGFVVIPFEYDRAEDFINGIAYVKKCNKYGFINKKQNIVIFVEYDNMLEFNSNGITVAVRGKKYGCINENNEIIIPFIYERICFTKDNRIIVKKDDKYGLFDSNGSIILDCDNDLIYCNTYPGMESYIDKLIVFHKDGVYGIIDENNKKVTLCQRSDGIINSIYAFEGNIIYTLKKEYEYFVNILYMDNNEIKVFKMDRCFEDNYRLKFINSEIICFVGYEPGRNWETKSSYGYIETHYTYAIYKITGEYIFRGSYTKDGDIFCCEKEKLIGVNKLYGNINGDNVNYSFGRGYVPRDPPCVFLDYNGNVKIYSENYAEIYPFNNRLAYVKLYRGQSVFIDTNNKLICDYAHIGDIKDGLIPVSDGNYQGCIDSENNVIIPFEYNIINIDHGFILVKDKNGKKIIDYANNQKFSNYTDIIDFSDGVLKVKHEMKYLYIDVCNGNIIKERYIANGVNLQTYFEFYDGLALINYQGRFGYVDKYARIVIPFIYDEATNFSNGISKTKIRGAWGSIDLKNNTVVRHMYKDIGLQIVYNVLLKYDIAKRYKYYISVRKDGKWGLLDKDENEILKPIFYDEIELVKVLSDDYVKIILDGRETIVNKNGKIIS